MEGWDLHPKSYHLAGSLHYRLTYKNTVCLRTSEKGSHPTGLQTLRDTVMYKPRIGPPSMSPFNTVPEEETPFLTPITNGVFVFSVDSDISPGVRTLVLPSPSRRTGIFQRTTHSNRVLVGSEGHVSPPSPSSKTSNISLRPGISTSDSSLSHPWSGRREESQRDLGRQSSPRGPIGVLPSHSTTPVQSRRRLGSVSYI